MNSKTRRTLFVVALVVVMVLTTTPPIAARTAESAPLLLRPSVPLLDVSGEAAEIAETISQIWEWFVSTDDDRSEEQDTEVQT